MANKLYISMELIEFIYDDLYKKFDSLFNEFNPCYLHKNKSGDTLCKKYLWLDNDEKFKNTLCCIKCRHHSTTAGCTIKCLPCKIKFCSESMNLHDFIERYGDLPEKFISEYKKLFEIATCINIPMSMIKCTKDQIVYKMWENDIIRNDYIYSL